MSATASSFAERLPDLRRRHFGPRGKGEFARRLNLSEDEYDKLERGHVPPGELVVRICEVTGEDLQWLLTGVAARGTMVISGARGRHQTLLTDIAALLEARPEFASPIEAFVDLLRREPSPRDPRDALPRSGRLIPLLAGPAARALTLTRPSAHEAALASRDPGAVGLHLDRAPDAAELSVKHCGRLLPLSITDHSASAVACSILAGRSASGDEREFLDQPDLAEAFPDMFGVWISEPDMAPMFNAGDAALVTPGVPARVGRPALCGLSAREEVRCRMWLGTDQTGRVQLGRLGDGARENLAADELSWSLEVLYRLIPAA